MVPSSEAELPAQPDAAPAKARSLAGRAPWFLIPILALAISVRLWGIEAGLPLIYHPDEPNYIRIAQNIFTTGDLNPRFFNYPSLFFYLNALAYVPFYLGGKLLGIFSSPADIVPPGPPLAGVSLVVTALPSSVLLGRLLTLAFSVGCVVLVYLIGVRVGITTAQSRSVNLNSMRIRAPQPVAVGLLAALIMAISPPAVLNGRTITPDTFVVFFILFACWGALRVYEQGDTRHYILAGIGIGLAGGAKYNGALIAIALITAHLLRNGPQGFKDVRLYAAGLVSIGTFILTTPYALLDYPSFIADVQFEAQHYYTGHLGMEGATLGFYLDYFRTVEGPIIFLALLEVVRGFATRSGRTILLAAFPILYFFFITQYTVRNDRTLLPLLPFAYILGSRFLVRLAGTRFLWVRGGRRPAARWVALNALAAAAIILVAFPATTMAQATVSRLSGIVARERAMMWISRNIPSGARIAVEAYTPFVDPQRYSLLGTPSLADRAPEWYLQNADYMVFSSFTFRRYYDERERFPTEVSRYDYMFNNFEQLAVFPHQDYEIRIYKIPKTLPR